MQLWEEGALSFSWVAVGCSTHARGICMFP